MNSRIYKTAENNIMDQVRGHGGTMIIDYRTDDVQRQMVRLLNKLADTGQLVKTVSDNHLIHTFTLPKTTGG